MGAMKDLAIQAAESNVRTIRDGMTVYIQCSDEDNGDGVEYYEVIDELTGDHEGTVAISWDQERNQWTAHEGHGMTSIGQDRLQALKWAERY